MYEHVEYFPFGEPWVDQGGTATLLPYKFTAKELDPETGLYYHGARYYEPRLHRWLSVDPAHEEYLTGKPNCGIFRPVNLNSYRYAANNPLRLLDPTGLADEENDDLIQEAMQLRRAQANAVREVAQATAPIAEAIAEANPVIGTVTAVTGESSATGRKLSKTGRIANLPVIGGALALGGKLLHKALRFGKAADAADAARRLPDDALVCRGGTCTAERFAKGKGVSLDSSGKLQGVSVNSAPGASLAELTETIPHPQVGVATVGDVRRMDGDVVPSPTASNPLHCTMCGITPEQAEGLVTPTVRNPHK